MENHQYFALGSVITSQLPNNVGEFERLVSERRWNELMAFNEWNGDEDEVVILALECPSAREITLKKVCDLAELYDNSYLLEDI